MKYASQTTVSVEKSRAEIETTLSRYGAEQFAYASDRERGLASIQFSAVGRHVRFVLKLPLPCDPDFQRTPKGQARRRPQAIHEAWEQACRQRWRALALCIKAKLEAVECRIASFEAEFLAFIVLPGGMTVGQLIAPQIEQAYVSGEVPPGIGGLLPYEQDVAVP